MEAAVEKRVMLLSAWAKRCVFKVLVLGNYYACRLKAITCRWPVLLTPTPEFLSVHRRYGVRQLAAALLCPGLPGGAPSPIWLCGCSVQAAAPTPSKTGRGKPRSAEAFGPQKAPMKARASSRTPSFP